MGAVCFYISGHGFGHASRQIEVVNALGAASPATPVLIRTSAPRWLFDRTLRTRATLLPGDSDTGVVQVDSLRLDAGETIRRAWAFHETLDERARAEAAVLRANGVSLVVSDAPPLACAAAAAAGIPSVVVANFTWDWIYGHYAPELERAPALVGVLRDAYALADAGWRLPMHGGFASIRRVLDVPFIARHARHAPADVRRICGLTGEAPLALVSFGGYGLKDLDLARLDCLDRYRIVVTQDGLFDGAVPEGVIVLSEATIYDAGLRYEDLVAAMDVVMTKPGYGIVSECIANGTALVYTSRGRFAEYEVMVPALPRVLRSAYLDQEDLFAGRWASALDAALAAPAPPDRAATDGADLVARMITDRM